MVWKAFLLIDSRMQLRSVRHDGLRRLMEADDAAGLPGAVVPAIRDALSFVQNMAAEDELIGLAAWSPQQTAGDQPGSSTWALHLAEGCRITFRVEREFVIDDLDLDHRDQRAS